MAGSGFWDNQDQAREVIVESNRLKSWVDPWKELDEKSSELVELGTLLEAESDDDLEAEWLAEIGEVERRSEALEVRTMLQGFDDHRGALLTVHPGAGGLESQDWAEMLTRMYMRWAERHGYSVNVLDLQPAEEAGIKSATLEVSGDDAYGYLKAYFVDFPPPFSASADGAARKTQAEKVRVWCNAQLAKQKARG